MSPAERLAQCYRHRETYMRYMADRMEDGDMHAVSDAANDVRELDAEIRTLVETLGLDAARRGL